MIALIKEGRRLAGSYRKMTPFSEGARESSINYNSPSQQDGPLRSSNFLPNSVKFGVLIPQTLSPGNLYKIGPTKYGTNCAVSC